jgi:hypothetical protein
MELPGLGLLGGIEAASNGRYRFVASTDTKDDARRIVIQAGWELAEFRANPVLLWDHGHSEALEREPIGRVPSIEVGSYAGRPALIAEIERNSNPNPAADRLWGMVDAGDLRAVSVGAVATVPPEYRFGDDGDLEAVVYAGARLMELSLVSVPSNPDALRIAAGALGAGFDPLFGLGTRRKATPPSRDRQRPTRNAWLEKQRMAPPTRR